jgi:hypothetical protein
MKKRLQKCLILLEEFYPRFPTFPHTAWQFRELAIKVKYKSAEKSRVFDSGENGLKMQGIQIREDSPLRCSSQGTGINFLRTGSRRERTGGAIREAQVV